jgi:TonB family protein
MIMKKTVCVCFTLLVLAFTTSAQDKPFEKFREAVKEEKGGFAGNKENLSRVFNDERIRLSDRFEIELWKYLGNNSDIHYWIGFFLTSAPYLHGNKPLPDLAVKVRIRTLELLKGRNDPQSLGRKVTLHRRLSISLKLLSRQDEAISHRDQAESILTENLDIGAYVGAMTLFDRCVYENIAGDITNCDQIVPPKVKTISAGWMNGRTLQPIEAIYPQTIKGKRQKAQVDVRILTDVDGSVTLAEIIKGPEEFHSAAIDAAKKVKFAPILLSGQPVKISGWLTIFFKP